MLSIALCTYNGARYLPEQLASISAQTRLPDELVVVDDASTDETLAILDEFARQAPFRVRQFSNEQNVGSTRNFSRAISLCEGDQIFLADQDDAWAPDKIVKLSQVLESAEVGLAFSDGWLMDEASGVQAATLWSLLAAPGDLPARVQRGQLFDLCQSGNLVTGATLAFRAAYRDLLLPVPHGWIHDAWIALVISAVASCAAIDEPLIQYRLHGGQQVGAHRLSPLDFVAAHWRGNRKTPDFCRLAAGLDDAVQRLRSLTRFNCPEARIQQLQEKAAHLRARNRIRASRLLRAPLLAQEMARGRYRRYSYGWRSAARDLVAW